jgi:general secretion pathway protein G
MRSRGFTLIEVVITVAIVGLLATAIFPLAELAVQRNREEQLRVALWDIRSAIDEYKAAADQGKIEMEVGQSGYPPTLNALVDGTQNISDPNLSMLYFLRRMPRDPFYPDPSTPAAETWGLRSYQSSPDDPQPGEDVFDVYSLSTRAGLNGIAYREW